ncbi:unnamed protein product [Clonostachys byssicola]|uniref:Uncharacterized protein n=1 Tax=Clonostachys byssicola TaxID=160290 RepID=A0A9N9UJB4_9HYPO|nr:unnamed protein product [Clonostachys byssicola]
MDECVGGGARPEEGPRFGVGPRARWAELAAGNCARRGGFAGRGGGGISDGAEPCDGAEEDAGTESEYSSSPIEKLGTGCEGIAGDALGVVCSSPCWSALKGLWELDAGEAIDANGGMEPLPITSRVADGVSSEEMAPVCSPRSSLAASRWRVSPDAASEEGSPLQEPWGQPTRWSEKYPNNRGDDKRDPHGYHRLRTSYDGGMVCGIERGVEDFTPMFCSLGMETCKGGEV